MKVTLDNPYANYDAAKLRTFLAHYKLTRDPGSGYEYSNVGFGLLGYALARHAGTGYRALLTKDVLQPLGMTSTGVTRAGTRLAPRLRKRLAPGYLTRNQPAGLWQFQSAMAGAGALYSDAHDLLIYVKANMGLVKTPLYPAMQLAQKSRRSFGARASRWGSPSPYRAKATNCTAAAHTVPSPGRSIR
jgi:CubicO group peptidase (beta-lactamase class C family)